jgi:DNA-binding transcriptional ArsR family regulator
MSDLFTVVAEPSRRQILDRLLASEASVTELIAVVGLSQTAMSKHLRVLRDSNLVTARIDAQRRVYALNSEPLTELDDWLSMYRSTWNRRVDALVEHLDRRYPADQHHPQQPDQHLEGSS